MTAPRIVKVPCGNCGGSGQVQVRLKGAIMRISGGIAGVASVSELDCGACDGTGWLYDVERHDPVTGGE